MLKNEKTLSRFFPLINAIWWLGYGLFSYAMGELWSASERHQYFQVPFIVVSGYLISYGLRYAFKLSWHCSTGLRLLCGVGALFLAVYLYAFLNTEFNYAVVEGRRSEDPMHIVGWAKYNLFIFGFWSATYLNGKYLLLYRSAERRLELAEALANKSRLEMLRYQLNPHFLFNTLNAINTLILDKQNDVATKTLTELAGFLRFSLNASDTQCVSLEKEIELLKHYVTIESIRFGERFKVEYDLDENSLPCIVPPMILQPIAENTIKYAVSRVEYPIILSIQTKLTDKTLNIVITDNGPGAPLNEEGMPSSEGIGLRNIRDRLQFYFQDKARCEFSNRTPHGFATTLYLPPGEIQAMEHV